VDDDRLLAKAFGDHLDHHQNAEHDQGHAEQGGQ
jgi:hypothetical protein